MQTSNDSRAILTFKQLRARIAEDYQTHERSVLRPGFQAMLMQRIGAWQLNIGFKPLAAVVAVVYHLAHIWVRNIYGIEIFRTTKVGRRLKIAHQSAINIHQWAEIGDDCMIRQGVTLGKGMKPGAPSIGNNVIIGAGAILVGGIRVGNNVNIGPNAVVITDVPDDSFVISPICKVLPRPKNEAQPDRPVTTPKTQ